MTSWLVETLIATSLLIAGVLLVRKPVARTFGPRIAYALWLLPALRMALPPLPAGWTGGPEAPLQQMSATMGSAFDPTMVIALWLTGALAFFGWHMARYLRFAHSLRASATPLYGDAGITISQSNQIASPLAYGVFGRQVMLPGDFAERYEAEEQRLAISHELSHHRRGDLIANIAALGLLSFNWFNPIAHFAFRAYRADQEAACDATVLTDATDTDRQFYGTALVKSALGSVPLVACPIGAASGVKERLGHIIAARETAQMHEAGLALSILTILAGLGFTASGMPEPSAPATRALPALAALDYAPTAPMIVTARRPIPVIEAPTIVTALKEKPQTAQQTIKPDVAPESATIEAPRRMLNDARGPALAAADPCAGSDVAWMRSDAIVQSADGTAHHMTLTLCGQAAAFRDAPREAMLGGLTRTRDKVEQDTRLNPDQRADMLGALDAYIRRVQDSDT